MTDLLTPPTLAADAPIPTDTDLDAWHDVVFYCTGCGFRETFELPQDADDTQTALDLDWSTDGDAWHCPDCPVLVDCDDCARSDRGVCGEHLAQTREDAACQAADEAWGAR